ncbi:unnamed protein product [Orchesella dallaii]|uniref:Protein kinase domain-containing protein n=1 Tax=Orchesella dallaii TaxID=48710 RepID=A0ABP1QBD7_9HEXA
MLAIREDAGDLPGIPIEPAESWNDERILVSHDKSRTGNPQFLLHEVIGRGGFSTVRRATCMGSNETYAFKILDKSSIQENFARVILEIETLMSVKNPHICKLHSVYYTSTKIYMVMEYCHTDLFEYLANLAEPMPENEARRLFIQLLDTISYLHNAGIAHRDIKPENILLTEKMDIRLTDFGLSSRINETKDGCINQKQLFTHCGSPAYCAPEIVLGQPYHGVKVDAWSLGVNLYVLLASELPFADANPQKVKARIINSDFRPQPHFSSGSLSLIKWMLQVDPQSRPTPQEIWKDHWIQEGIQIGHRRQRCRQRLTQPIDSKQKPENSIQLCYKPTIRSDTVQIDRPTRRSIVCRLINSTGKKISKVRNLILCRS